MAYDTSVGSPLGTLARVLQKRLHEPSESLEPPGEILSVPSFLGEPTVPGGVFPKEAFEMLYEKVVP
jgi:hypothetical protein